MRIDEFSTPRDLSHKPAASEGLAAMADNPVLRALAYLSVSAVLVAGLGRDWYWAPLVSASVFGILSSSPRFRPRVTEVLTPRASLYWVGLLALVIVPWSISAFGAYTGVLPQLPSESYINAATLLVTFYYTLLVAGFHIGILRWRGNRQGRSIRITVTPLSVVLGFAVLGIVGGLVRVGAQGGLATYFSGIKSEEVGTASGLLGVAAAFGPPFLLAAVLLQWRNRETLGTTNRLERSAYVIVGVLPMLVYSYNRAAPVTTLLLLLTIAAAARPPRRAMVVLVAAALLLGGFAFGQFRSETILGVTTETSPSIVDFVQAYATGPQFVGFGLESANPTDGLSTLVNSALAPVPTVGEGTRAQAGPRLYNQLIYGDTSATDQVLPVPLELFWTGTPVLVALAGLVLGYAIGSLQRLWRRTSDLVAGYLSAFVSAWIAASVFVSISVIMQVLLYFGTALLCALIASRFLTVRATPGRAGTSPSEQGLIQL